MKRVQMMKLLGALMLSAAVALAAPGAKGDKPKKAENQKAAPAKGGGDVSKGEDIFKQNCAVCHNTTSTETRIGPGLKGLFKRDKLTNGKAVTDANVRELIREGNSKMMPFKERLDKKQLDDLVAYLHTL